MGADDLLASKGDAQDEVMPNTPTTSDGNDDPALKYFDCVLPADDTKLGLHIIGSEVVKVSPGSWAAVHNIEIDDEIWKIQGQRFGPMDDKSRFRALTQARPFTINFKRPLFRDIYLSRDWDDRSLGLKYWRETIGVITPGGWADRSGLQVGDTIFEIQGKEFRSLTVKQILELFTQQKPLNFVFKRPHPMHLDWDYVNECREALGEDPIPDPRAKDWRDEFDEMDANNIPLFVKASAIPNEEQDLTSPAIKPSNEGGFFSLFCLCMRPVSVTPSGDAKAVA